MRSSYPRTSSHSNYQNGDCVTGGMAPGPSLAMKMWRQVISKLTPLVMALTAFTMRSIQFVMTKTASIMMSIQFVMTKTVSSL